MSVLTDSHLSSRFQIILQRIELKSRRTIHYLPRILIVSSESREKRTVLTGDTQTQHINRDM